MPVLVKVSYFPNWQVSGADGPYRVAPNEMVVIPTSTHVSMYVRTFARATSCSSSSRSSASPLAIFARIKGDMHFPKLGARPAAIATAGPVLPAVAGSPFGAMYGDEFDDDPGDVGRPPPSPDP